MGKGRESALTSGVYQRQDNDYSFAEADTTYGNVGVKVWIYEGEVLPAKKANKEGSEQ